MKMCRVNALQGWSFGVLVLLVGSIALVSIPVAAQKQGQNAVFIGTSPQNSTAFVDAANFSSTSGLDFCDQLHAVLSSTIAYIQQTNWQVIDARGITSNTCAGATYPNPWSGFSSFTSPPWVTVLLPAGTITISKTWTLPPYTRIVGQGPETTTLLAASGFSGPMVEMGCTGLTSSVACGPTYGVGVEGLTLNGGSQTTAFDGIDNSDAEEQSYVKHVQMIGISGVGLSLDVDTANGATSSHSGPYSDISITESGNSACINIAPNAQPRGIHGINCNSASDTGAGIYLDGSNVSVEDVNVNGFAYGIEIGSQGSRNTIQSDIVFNVTGGSSLTDVVLVSSSNTVIDLSLMGITKSGTNSIQDNETGTTLSDATVGMYVLGEPVAIGSKTYSRFTTSPSVPTWLIGTASPSGSCAPAGAIYSRTSSSTSPPTIWGCAASNGWQAIK